MVDGHLLLCSNESIKIDQDKRTIIFFISSFSSCISAYKDEAPINPYIHPPQFHSKGAA